jgi:hypothetical protein
MNNVIIFHGDLDGLYSALLFKKAIGDEIEIAKAHSVDYGQDHSTLKHQYDNFFIFDFADNIGGEKTRLWVDHHLRQGENGAELTVIEESPSCVRLMLDFEIIPENLIPETHVQYIDAVDSASYVWSSAFSKEELIFPDLKNGELSKFIALNQLLRKNRKFGIAEKLFYNESTDIDVLHYRIEKDRGQKTVKYMPFMEAKQRLMERLVSDNDKYIKWFSGIPVLFTKEFSTKDWRGYDMNMFGYLVNKSPFLIIIFDMSNGINVQVTQNIFFDGKSETVYSIIKDAVTEVRGHEGIMNFSFSDYDSAIENLDLIIAKLAEHL